MWNAENLWNADLVTFTEEIPNRKLHFLCSGSTHKELTAQNTVISPNFMVWKCYGNAQFLHSFMWFARNSAESMRFHNISTPGNLLKFRLFEILYWIDVQKI